MVKSHNAQKVIFENPLKPVQAYNISKLTGVEAIDRFQLILEIFAKRASTQEAQLQIRLATLRYRLPKARESIRLARLGEQPGFMGLGRYEVDVYIEDVKRQISHIRKELMDIRGEREQRRTRRIELGFPLVSLAGYTKAGKTSLFNLLAKESKPVDLGLFTTLSPSTRLVNFAGRRALLSDTVGFIDSVPLLLIEAFHSTLEEMVYADTIILILDAHDAVEEIRRKLNASLNTINAIGAAAVPRIVALNKVDLLSRDEADEKLKTLSELVPDAVPISALTGFKANDLKLRVAETLGEYMEATFFLPNQPEVSSFIHTLYASADSIQVTQKGNNLNLVLKASPTTMEMLKHRVEKNGGRLLRFRSLTPSSGTRPS